MWFVCKHVHMLSPLRFKTLSLHKLHKVTTYQVGVETGIDSISLLILSELNIINDLLGTGDVAL